MIFAAWEKGWIKMSEYIERDRLLKVLEHNFYGLLSQLRSKDGWRK